VAEDYARTPIKPTLDGEPSCEKIPQGLHDATQPYWTDADVRRYAYWSVFAGSFGHTYGNNAVQQMYEPGDGRVDFAPKNYWFQAIDDPGAGQTAASQAADSVPAIPGAYSGSKRGRG
jgi:hypothetical protein